MHRGPRKRTSGLRLRVRPGRLGHAARCAARGQPRRRARRSLRRNVSAVRRRAASRVGPGSDVHRHERAGPHRSGDPPEHAHDLGGIAEQSAAETGRSRDGRQRRASTRDTVRRGQHVCNAMDAAAARIRIRRGGAFGHEIPERPLRHGGRCDRRSRQSRARRAPRVPAERGGQRTRALRQLPCAARD